jgi:CRP-like cAMP-binding protein
MHEPRIPLSEMARRLDRLAPLSASDRAAMLALPYSLRSVPAATHLVRDGERPQACCVLIAGFACRYKLTGEGERQILAIHMRGEFVDLQNMFLGRADHSVQTLTDAEMAVIPNTAIRELALSRPTIAQALWTDTLVDASIFREWMVNVGRRDSRGRVAHILCELALRLEQAELGRNDRFELPMTQEQLADAVGLTSVHVNRVLKQLGAEGLISRDRRTIRIDDWRGLRAAGDFNDRYLHPAK